MENDKEKDEFNSDWSNPEEDRIEYEKRMEREKRWKKYDEETALEPGTFGFWELAVKTTLIVAFFPWSLLFCVWFYGMDETIYLYKAILRDLLVVVVGLVLGVVGLCSIILLIAYLLN